MEKTKVLLTYFRHSGKYYSEGEYETSEIYLGDVVDEVIEMNNKGKMPGVGSWFGSIYVDFTHDTYGCPYLIIQKNNNTHE